MFVAIIGLLCLHYKKSIQVLPQILIPCIVYDLQYKRVSTETQALLDKFLAKGPSDPDQEVSISIANVAQQTGFSD